ncbi:MAG: hypothetical protein EA378_01375 [Phycisphaerales bacterium]|nr:MAG: hypothetical protein EA378_01375 [Phycisphaerales bacterium]
MLLALTGLALVLAPAHASGGEPAPGGELELATPSFAKAPLEIRRLIERLDAHSPGDRAVAEATLSEHPDFDLATASAVARDPALTPEQRQRLLNVGWRLFRAHPRAAMGISFGGEVDAMVRITNAIEPFDAARLLQAGDLIDTLDARPVRASSDGDFSAQNDMQIEILSRLPHERMRVTGFRHGQAFEGEIELGRWNQLNQAGTPDESLLRAAWLRRVHRMELDRPLELNGSSGDGKARGAVIDAVTPLAIRPNSYEAFEMRMATSNRFAREIAPAVSVVGPDTGWFAELDPRLSHAAGIAPQNNRPNMRALVEAREAEGVAGGVVEMRVLPDNNPRRMVLPGRDDPAQAAAENDQARIAAQLRRVQQARAQQMQNLERLIEQLDTALETPLTPGDRTLLIERRDSYLRTIRGLQEQVDLTERQLRELGAGVQP